MFGPAPVTGQLQKKFQSRVLGCRNRVPEERGAALPLLNTDCKTGSRWLCLLLLYFSPGCAPSRGQTSQASQRKPPPGMFCRFPHAQSRDFIAEIKGRVGTSLSIHRDIFSLEAVPLNTCTFLPVIKSSRPREAHLTVVSRLTLALNLTCPVGLHKSLYLPGLGPGLRWERDLPTVTFSQECL